MSRKLQLAGNTQPKVITAGVGGTNQPLPTDGAGNKCRLIMVVVIGGTSVVGVKPTSDVGDATAFLDCALLPPNFPVLIEVSGHTHLRVISGSGTPQVGITPIENT